MSGAIVKLAFPNTELIGWDYGNDIPDLSFNEVIMVDVSFPRQIMEEHKYQITWIDHHISAINDIGELGKSINGLRDTQHAACELTWMYFFPDTPMPEIVRLLGRYDCFGHKGTAEELKVLEFQYGARQAIGNVNEAYASLIISRGRGDWSLDADQCDDIHLQGKAIYKYLCTEAKGIYKRSFPITINDYKFLCVNQDRFNPINFGIDYHNEGYDGFACFWYQNGQFTYSLYNDNGNVDCSAIAKQYGGGGHKGAAGFRSDKIIT
jgi:oligoribonuclease NrnB/cAMP/cGMP phosphodiesterase (DHH superfamily)